MNTPLGWQSLRSSSISRRHSGDIDGAIKDMIGAISLTREVQDLTKETSVNLNYLADMYLECNALEEAETAIREAIELSRQQFPGLLADDLCGLAEIQRLKG
jgi:hypothetical protein